MQLGCATQHDSFKKTLRPDQNTEEVEMALTEANIDYRFVTCEEAQKEKSIPARKCAYDKSLGMYVGYSNDGSYILGAGSSDVAFEIEIGPDQQVIDIRTRNVYTFL